MEKFCRPTLTILLACQVIMVTSSSIPLGSSQSQEILVSHGEICNRTHTCNISSLLTCHSSQHQQSQGQEESTCQCILPESMIYSGSVGRCQSLVDEPCGQLSLEESSVITEVHLQCQENAHCVDSICQCNGGYYYTDGHSCTKQSGFGQECSESKECLSKIGLVCLNETCGCDVTTSVDSSRFYDHEDGESERRCLGRPELPCLNDECVPNSKCQQDFKNPAQDDNSKLCICEPGFVKSKSGKLCVGTYNKSCDTQSNLLCQRDFSCVKGQCGCKYPLHQVYDKEKKLCVGLVGAPCDIDAKVKGQCGMNSVCQPRSDSDSIQGQGQIDDGDTDTGNEQRQVWNFCICEDGFVENLNRTCDVAFGQPCSQILEDWRCDSVARLVCRDGVCSCPDPIQIFDKVSMKCRGLVGSACDLRLEDQCIANAKCKSHRAGFVPFGHCQCDEDHETTEEHICV